MIREETAAMNRCKIRRHEVRRDDYYVPLLVVAHRIRVGLALMERKLTDSTDR
jgi:hypothetical protein